MRACCEGLVSVSMFLYPFLSWMSLVSEDGGWGLVVLLDVLSGRDEWVGGGTYFLGECVWAGNGFHRGHG